MNTGNSTDGLFAGAATQGIKNAADTTNENENNNAAIWRLLFWLLVIGIIVGSEVTKVLFRKNYFVNLNKFIRIIFGAVTFGYIGKLFITNTSEGFKGDSTFAMGCIFMGASVYILIQGIVHFVKSLRSGNNYSSRGESILLAFLKKEKWNNSLIQNLAEPILILAIGVFFLGFNLIGGVALMACALGYWINLLFEYALDQNDLNATVSNTNLQVNKERVVHNVN